MDSQQQFSQIRDWLNFMWGGFGCGRLYKNFPEIIAQKAVSLTVGQGIIFNGDKKATDILNKWFIKNNVLEKLRKGEYISSLWGKSIYFLQPTKDGNIILSYVKNLYQGRVATVNEHEQAADIWSQDYVGDSPYFAHITYTTKEIKVEFYASLKNRVRIGVVESEIQNDLIPEKTYTFKNELGLIPVVEVENLPVNNIWNSTYGNFRPDWAPVADLINLYNEVVRISNVELVANRTRIFGELTPEQIKELKKDHGINSPFADIMKDSWVNASFNSGYDHLTTGNMLNIIQGNPQLKTYSDYEEFMDDLIMNGSGYSSTKVGNNQTYQNKTASLFADKRDKETTDYKQALRRPKFYKIFDYVLKFYGVEPFDEKGQRIYSFDFNNLAISDTAKKISQNTELLENGIISQTEYRADVFNEPLDVASKNIQEARKEYLAHLKEELALDIENDMNDVGSEKRDLERKKLADRERKQVDNDEWIGDK